MGYFLWNGLRIIDQKYLTGLLEPRVMPCAGFVGDGFMLMLARPHVAICVRQYLQEIPIAVMKRLAYDSSSKNESSPGTSSGKPGAT